MSCGDTVNYKQLWTIWTSRQNTWQGVHTSKKVLMGRKHFLFHQATYLPFHTETHCDTQGTRATTINCQRQPRTLTHRSQNPNAASLATLGLTVLRDSTPNCTVNFGQPTLYLWSGTVASFLPQFWKLLNLWSQSPEACLYSSLLFYMGAY